MTEINKTVLIESAKPHRRVVIDRLPFVIGSGLQAELAIQDEHVSEVHACIVEYQNKLGIFDLGSRNGTYVIPAKREKQGDGIKPVPAVKDVQSAVAGCDVTPLLLEPGMNIAFASNIWTVDVSEQGLKVSQVDKEASARQTKMSPPPSAMGSGPKVNVALEMVMGPEVGRYISITSLPVIVGRSCKKSDIALEDCTAVSGEHLSISMDKKGRVFVEDLNSRNGTQINGKHISGRTQIRDKSTVTLSKEVAFKVHINKRKTVLPRVLLMLSALVGLLVVLNFGITRTNKENATHDLNDGESVVNGDIISEDGWRKWLGQYDEYPLAGLQKEYESISFVEVSEHWDVLTNRVEQLSELLATNRDVTQAVYKVDGWQKSAERTGMASEIPLEILNRYAMNLVLESVRVAVLDAIRHNQLDKARDNIRIINPWIADNVYWQKVQKVEENLRTMSTLADHSFSSEWSSNSEWNERVEDITSLVAGESGLASATQECREQIEKELIQKMIESAKNQENVVERLRVLRCAQQIDSHSEVIAAEVEALRPKLEPEYRRVLFGGIMGERRQVLLELTNSADWTGQYRGRLKN